ncbi:MAG TPA: hypothetical protein VKJ00_02335, partial [Thermoanaerobaculia bacterium]|nr:hypothetical protein [Thermoanaerobaculia bacterium]
MVKPGSAVSTVARNAATAMLIGLAIIFLVFATRKEIWDWRLALYGAAVGLFVFLTCHVLDRTIGAWIRESGFLDAKLVAVPLYFVGGCVGLLAATALMRAANLIPFLLTSQDLGIALL